MNRPMMLLALCLLAGCAKNAAQDVHMAARQTAVNVRDQVKEVTGRVKTYFVLPAYQPAQSKPPQTAYCYRTQSDILCYRDPVPGAEMRLVAFQGVAQPDGSSQVVAVMEEPPLVTAKDRAPSARPAYRAVDPQPIFVGIAPGVAGAESALQGAGAPKDLMHH